MKAGVTSFFAARSSGGAGADFLSVLGALSFAIVLPIYLGSSLTLSWMLAGAIGPAYVFSAPLLARRPQTRFLATVVYAAFIVIALAVILSVLWATHRRFLILVAAAHAVLATQFLTSSGRPRALVMLIAGLCATWGMSAVLSYTAFENLVINATGSNALIVPVLVVAVAFVTIEVLQPGEARLRAKGRLIAGYAVAVLVFAELALRSDALFREWTPYHRSYFIDPAAFVRTGHWLLWDVPSQYGFLSVVTLAVTPVQSIWQALYIDIAVALVVQALMMFSVLRAGRRGVWNYAFALCVPLAVLFSSEAARWPFGARLYPQQSLRFLWPLAVLFVIFRLYRATAERDRRLLWFAGWTAWALGLAWSFEVAVWTSLVWLPFVAVDALCDVRQRKSAGHALLTRIVPLVAVPIALIAVVELVYAIRLHHGPDWVGFVEFSVLYASGSSDGMLRTPLAGWLIVLVLAVVLTIGLAVILARRFHVLPLVAAMWGAAWGTSIYYAGEPFNDHVNILCEVLVFTAGIALYIVRTEHLQRSGPIVRLAMTPMLAILLATTFGEPTHMAAVRAPFFPGYHGDSTAAAPVISGELAELMQRHIPPGDPVVFPYDPGLPKVDLGLILPFRRLRDGRIVEVQSWLPESPVGARNAFYSLSWDRRHVYSERFLRADARGGWAITYHRTPDCAVLSDALVTVDVVSSTNFAAARCSIRRDGKNHGLPTMLGAGALPRARHGEILPARPTASQRQS